MEEGGDISFVDQGFLGSKLLDDSNALEYFSASPFYDKSCNNEILKMQTQFRGLDQKSKLSTMIGTFYEMVGSNQDKTLFVIRKAFNHEHKTETIGMYYIIHGHVYPAPTNHAIYRCRMGESMWVLSSFISKMTKKRKFNPFNATRVGHLSKAEDAEDLQFLMEVFNDFKKRVEQK